MQHNQPNILLLQLPSQLGTLPLPLQLLNRLSILPLMLPSKLNLLLLQLPSRSGTQQLPLQLLSQHSILPLMLLSKLKLPLCQLFNQLNMSLHQLLSKQALGSQMIKQMLHNNQQLALPKDLLSKKNSTTSLAKTESELLILKLRLIKNVYHKLLFLCQSIFEKKHSILLKILSQY